MRKEFKKHRKCLFSSICSEQVPGMFQVELIPPHQCVGIAIQYAHASRIEDRGENVKKCRKKKFSEWVARVSRNTPTSKTINSELSRASQVPYRSIFFAYFPYYSLGAVQLQLQQGPLSAMSNTSPVLIWDNYYIFKPMTIGLISNPNLILKLFSGIRLDPTPGGGCGGGCGGCGGRGGRCGGKDTQQAIGHVVERRKSQHALYICLS